MAVNFQLKEEEEEEEEEDVRDDIVASTVSTNTPRTPSLGQSEPNPIPNHHNRQPVAVMICTRLQTHTTLNTYASCERRTISLTLFLKAVLSFLHMTAASKLAGLSSLGSDNIEITETMMDSTPRMGRHRSIAVSCGLKASSPGGCKIEMHTLPSGYTSQQKLCGGEVFIVKESELGNE